MKSLLIAIKPKWCAKIMNGEKTFEVRKNKALATAIQKLIDENGYAEFYVYCTKNKSGDNDGNVIGRCYPPQISLKVIGGRGKVIFKFRCYKMNKIELKRVNDYSNDTYEYMTDSLSEEELLEKSCIHTLQLSEYLGDDTGYAIHISELEIFDRPKELSEFYALKCSPKEELPCNIKDVYGVEECFRLCKMCKPLTKAPQNYCYVEVE